MNLDNLIRENIKKLKPYSSARDEYKGGQAQLMDANENPYNSPLNRYPDPLQLDLKSKIVSLKGCRVDQLFLGNGSDEAIDLLIRVFCDPGRDNLIITDPTYGMYQVCADINNVEVKRIPLDTEFDLDHKSIIQQQDENTRLIFLCSPNNPTGNLLSKDRVLELIRTVDIPVVIDEAYIDFALEESFVSMLNDFDNLVVLQTFSKAWGMAGARLGMAMASAEIIGLLNKIKYPYNVNLLTQKKAEQAIRKKKRKDDWVKRLLVEKVNLIAALQQMDFVKEIFHSDANFFLIKVDEPSKLYHYLVDQKIIVRDRSGVLNCEGCLRITVGTPRENKKLLNALKNYHS